jgi:ornithine cyclodeaminase
MATRIVTQEQVLWLLPMHECVEIMSDVLQTLARGEAQQPLRTLLRLPDQSGLLGLMPATLAAPPIMGMKLVSVMPGNHGTEYDAHQGVVVLFEIEHGCPIAIVDASSITQIRTAAVSGAATRAMAREDAGDLAIIGSGVQAESHLEAMRTVRTLRRVRVWSKTSERARDFALAATKRTGLKVEPMRSAREAVEGADLVCTTTSAKEPIVKGEWLAPGVHVNAVGACFPTTRELDTAAVRDARVIVDRRESALNEAGEILLPIKEGAFGADHIVGELGEVLLGTVKGRTSPIEKTVFKSLGIAVEDLAAAHHIYLAAERDGVGISLELGGRRTTHA